MSPRLERVSVMFTVATLAFASPVYLHLLELPSPSAVFRLALSVQIAPTVLLTLADLGLAGLERSTVWCGRWRAALYFLALLASARQVQIWLDPDADRLGAAALPVAAVTALGLLALVTFARPALGTFFAAFAPALVLWTLSVGYGYGLSRPAPTAHGSASLTRAEAKGPPVFILLFDELDRGVLMPSGQVKTEFPNFRRLAGDSVVFTDATSNYHKTCYSVPSLLTGKLLPRLPLCRQWPAQPIGDFQGTNLLSMLAKRMEVRVYGQYLRYCYDSAFRCRGTADLQARYPYLPLLQYFVPDHVRRPLGLAGTLGYSQHTYTLPLFDHLLADIAPATAPGTVFYLHLTLPHGPYVFDEKGGVAAAPRPSRWRDRSEYVMMLRHYKRQAQFVDLLLGRFIAKLEAAGLYEKSVIVITSDHGFWSFRDFAPPEVVDGIEINSARPRVPLIIHAPQLRPGVSTTDYQHVDFKGTVLTLLGMNADSGAPSVFASHADRRKVFCDGLTWYARAADETWAPQRDEDGQPACREPDSDESTEEGATATPMLSPSLARLR